MNCAKVAPGGLIRDQIMYRLSMRYATPLITSLFVISLVSGVALFFHWGQAYFREMHEWLSMVLLLPFVLHIVRNWKPFIAYFKHVPMTVALLAGVGGAGVYAWQGASGGPGGNPMVAVAMVIQKSSLATAAPLFGHTPESLNNALTAKGYKISTNETKLADIALASDKETVALLRDLAAVAK